MRSYLLVVVLPLVTSWIKLNQHVKFQDSCSRKLVMKGLTVPESDPKLKFDLGKVAFSLLPLSPESTGRRKTILTEIVPNNIWTLDQIQGIINVNVPVRSTIIKLRDGGLFINNPVGPTSECLQIVKDLELKYGKVKYIALSTLGLEHKGTASAFTGYFPYASIWVQPGQYSFPVNLPTEFFFPIGRKINEIPKDCSRAPWFPDIEHEVLQPLKPKGVGGFSETAFFHRSTKTLLVTDAIVKITEEPPAIVQDDPRALIYHARDNMFEIAKDTPENRRKGWRRMVLFGLVFQPGGINITDTGEAIRMLKDTPEELRVLGQGTIPYDGRLYPWTWVEDDKPSFNSIANGLLVAPILRYLIFNREPELTMDWVNRICKWPFQRIISCHLDNNVKATPNEFRDAFSFLEVPPSFPNNLFTKPVLTPLPKDRKVLEDVSVLLTKNDVLKPEAPLLPRR